MKKTVLALVLVIMLLAGCGKNPQAGNKASTEKLVSEESAKSFVLTLVNGASEKDIRKFKKEFDDGKWVYDVKVVYNEMEYEFELDAQTGGIINWDSESIYD